MFNFFRKPFLFLIRVYQKTISPDHGIFKNLFPHGYCRFYPTCSEYGYQAIKKRGVVVGSFKIVWRILRCNPWSRGGVDLPDSSIIFTGEVLSGQGKGDEVGAKTANLDVSLAAGLSPGLYDCTATIESGAIYRGLLYYGYNSLSQKDCLEVHLLNFSGDLKGKKITVTTKKFLRLPEKFDSVADLRVRVSEDLKKAS